MFSKIRKLVFGRAGAQMLQLLALPLLSRMYTPTDFGVQYEAQSIATIIAVIYTLQLHLIIPLEKTKDAAREATLKVQSLCFIIFAIFFTGALLTTPTMIWAVCLALFVALNNTYTSYLVQQGQFSLMSIFFVVRAGLVVFLQLIFAVLHIPDGLLIATVLAEGIASVYLWVTHIFYAQEQQFIPHKSMRLARDTVSFSVYGTLQELITVSAFFMPFLLFQHVFDEAIAAQYAMSGRLIWAPVILIGASTSQVIYHEIGKVQEINTKLILSVSPSWQHVALLVVLCILVYFGRGAFLLILGPAWELSSQLAPLQMIWAVSFLLTVPSRTILRAMHLQKLQFAIELAVVFGMVALSLLPYSSPLQMMAVILTVALAQNMVLFTCGRYAPFLRRKLQGGNR